MPLHVASTYAHHQEVKIASHSLWYHHTYRCDDTRGWILCIKLVNYWDKYTELCFTANTRKPSCGMSYLLTKSQAQHWKALCTSVIQAGLLLHNFFFWNFALKQLENLHHFLNLRNNVRFHVIWQDDMR